MSLTNEECSICLETLQNEIAHLSCNHFFHYKCIGEWINEHTNKNTYCPICNQLFDMVLVLFFFLFLILLLFFLKF